MKFSTHVHIEVNVPNLAAILSRMPLVPAPIKLSFHLSLRSRRNTEACLPRVGRSKCLWQFSGPSMVFDPNIEPEAQPTNCACPSVSPALSPVSRLYLLSIGSAAFFRSAGLSISSSENFPARTARAAAFSRPASRRGARQ